MLGNSYNKSMYNDIFEFSISRFSHISTRPTKVSKHTHVLWSFPLADSIKVNIVGATKFSKHTHVLWSLA